MQRALPLVAHLFLSRTGGPGSMSMPVALLCLYCNSRTAIVFGMLRIPHLFSPLKLKCFIVALSYRAYHVTAHSIILPTCCHSGAVPSSCRAKRRLDEIG